MEMTSNLQDAIVSNVQESQLRKIAIKDGMKTLRMDGLIKAKQGFTSLDQVLEKTVLQKESLPAYLLTPDEMIFENGDIIIKEGNSDTNFFKLIQGCLEVYKGSEKIAEISQPDSYFGEMSALLGGRRTATIKSAGKSIVKVFPGDKLQETLTSYPEIAKQVIGTLVKRLEQTNEQLVDAVNVKTDLERTMQTMSPKAGARAAQGGQHIRPAAARAANPQARARPRPSVRAAAAGPTPLKKPGDQTQSIQVPQQPGETAQAGGGPAV
jgi:CRP-like cAMP-binding protein